MRTRKHWLIALFLCTWSIISYFLLIRQTSQTSYGPPKNVFHSINEQNQFLQKLDRLENSIRDENLLHDQLIRKLVKIIELTEQQQQNGELLEVGSLRGEMVNVPAAIQQQVNNVDNKFQVEHFEDNSINENAIGAKEIKETPLEKGTGVQEEAQIALVHKLKQLTKENLENVDFTGPVIPVLVFACNRISVRICLDNLIRYRSNARQFPIIVSQDCEDEATRNVIESYKEVTLMRQPDQSDIYVLPKDKKFKGYYKIARHYGWALNTTFSAGFNAVIIVEDDLNVAPDFYEYFHGTHDLLKNDSTLWCVSAWNDNGKSGVIDETRPDLLYRTDFFPGLGWMLTKQLWEELSVKWPKAFWDDWIRQPQQRKGRACIRPEISRTQTFGKIGVSNGLFFEKHLRYIKLSENFVPFTKMNLSYLLKENYDKQFLSEVYSYPVVTFEELRRGLVSTKDAVRIQYNTREQFKRTSKLLGLMDDFKSGVPRTGYFGIVSFFYNNQRIYLAPSSNWKGYDLSWS